MVSTLLIENRLFGYANNYTANETNWGKIFIRIFSRRIMDKTTTIAELKELIGDFIVERDWEKYQVNKNLAMSIAIEAAELMEHFQWQENGEAQQLLDDPSRKAEIGEELADILVYCLSFSIQADLDISEIVQAKMEKNAGRFPPGAGLGE
jgi:NTP pyrophosphatase (non-canonical NTP hydrolase)